MSAVIIIGASALQRASEGLGCRLNPGQTKAIEGKIGYAPSLVQLLDERVFIIGGAADGSEVSKHPATRDIRAAGLATIYHPIVQE